MVIDPRFAAVFIADYSQLLLEVQRLTGRPAPPDLLQQLAAGREALETTPELLPHAVTSLEARGVRLSSEVRRAIETLRVRQWVYLQDTSKYSIFLAQQEREAFGVIGLTDPIRQLLGGSAVTFRAGVLEYRGRYVCDGIFGGHVWLDPGDMRDFRSLFKEIQTEGGFRVACEL